MDESIMAVSFVLILLTIIGGIVMMYAMKFTKDVIEDRKKGSKK